MIDTGKARDGHGVLLQEKNNYCKQIHVCKIASFPVSSMTMEQERELSKAT